MANLLFVMSQVTLMNQRPIRRSKLSVKNKSYVKAFIKGLNSQKDGFVLYTNNI